MTFGLGWFLNVISILPKVNWFLTLSVAACGLIFLITDKINKFNFVIGMFLITVSISSIFRQLEKITLDMEVPVLVIVLGLLMFIAQAMKLPNPDWIIDKRRKQ